ncbi:MAG: hypothetical protein COU46_01930 [Candidatus Niyogibacteria bacterium CG10_big_fil_rev_8_21_14_0_10_42_19]|uniref:Uncharacterized protein n=1 Tax=Candidatus Niyogibacteria bacterium CG10_big_fil_rev_8_21_14_0_10_42_19 TaxID=1974725 RepID=A0A2H0TFM8_9BACT|nr:MAG: hypothetical protein COU46_01930 [Candidatus Niyogibacteria bacterium CG10_big_fil_rev_8_21_14_0_10_42_19]
MVKKNTSSDDMKNQLLELLRFSSRSEGFIGRQLKTDHKTVKKIITGLCKEGHQIEERKGYYFLVLNPRSEFHVISTSDHESRSVATSKFLLTGDFQLGARDSQVHLIKTIGAVAKKEGVDSVIVAGDILNGMRVFRGQDRGENRINNIDGQEALAVSILENIEVPTAFRDGNHEAPTWIAVGHNPMWSVYKALVYEKQKKNFTFVLPAHPYYEVNGIIVELAHPYKGQTQKKTYGPINALTKRLGSFTMVTRNKLDLIKSNMQNGGSALGGSAGGLGQNIKPHIRAIGNMHTCVSAIHAGVAFYLVPCLQKSTGFERAKELWHQVGIWIVSVSINSLGRVCGVTNKYIPWDHLTREHNEEEIALHSRIDEECVLRRPD